VEVFNIFLPTPPIWGQSDIMARNYNVFGKIKWEDGPNYELALNATKVRQLAITEANRNNYGPFARFWLENRSTEVIRVDLNGAAMGDDTIRDSITTEYVQPATKIEFAPYENGEPDYVFYKVSIMNTDAAANTANDEIVWGIRNW